MHPLSMSFRAFMPVFAGLIFLLPGVVPRCLAVIAGDHFAEAVDLGSGVPVEHVRPANAGLTLEPGEENDVTGSHWLTWVCPAAGVYEARGTYPKPQSGGSGTLMGFDPLVEVLTGTALPSLTAVPYVPLGIVTEPRRFHGEPGRRYYFRTGLTPYGGYYTNLSNSLVEVGLTFPFAGTGNFTFTLKKLADAPPNDDFARAAVVPAGNDVTVTGTNTGASNETGEVLGLYEAGDSVWHRWTAGETGRYELLLTSPAFVKIGVFSGGAPAALTLNQQGTPNYNDPVQGIVRLRWAAQAGDERYFRITGNGYGQQGDYTLRLHRLAPPVNDNMAAALPVEGALPLSISGTTVDASPEAGLEGHDTYLSSSVWWKWTAGESGWCELAGDSVVGIMMNGVPLGYTLNNSPPFRFRAVAGQVYFLRAATQEAAEKPVTLSLGRISGLEHSTLETALEMVSGPSFSSMTVAVPDGSVITETGVNSYSALWCRWTAPVSGWVALDTEGSADGAEMVVRTGDQPGSELQRSSTYSFYTLWQAPSVNYPSPDGNHFWSWSLFPPARQVLPETLVQAPALAPRTARLLQRVEGGKIYFFAVLPPRTSGGSANPVKMNLRPAAGPPEVLSVRMRDLPPATARDPHMLEAVVMVSSPNGLVQGKCSLMDSAVYVTDATRISGDVRAGEYRVVLPLRPGYDSGNQPPPISVSLLDTRGGSYFSSTQSLLNIAGAPPVLKVSGLPSSLKDTADNQAPIVEGGDDQAGGILSLSDGLVAQPRVIHVRGEALTIVLRLGIRDLGGSGFAAGEIQIAQEGAASDGIFRRGGPPAGAVFIGPEHRCGGDAQLGIYEVPFTIPANAPSGRIICRLRDAAGNVAGRWLTGRKFSTVMQADLLLGMSGIPGGMINERGSLAGPDPLAHDISAAGGLNIIPNGITPNALTSFYFEDSMLLPYIVEQAGAADMLPPVISESAAILDAEGNIRLSGRITDDLAGVTGGVLLLSDKHGLIEAQVAFTAAQRTGGTALDGRYEITVPVPHYGFGGAHYLGWSAQDGVGRLTGKTFIGPVTLPDRTVEDQRRPRLTHFQISPAAVNLMAGPAEISVSLGAGDDRPGITAVCRILDSAGALLAERRVGCDQPVLDCVSTVTLPARVLIGLSSAARVELVLTDSAGRTEIYGQPGGSAWPEGSAVSLTLGPVSDPFTLWAASWPGVPALPPDGARDSDHDSVPDLLEFALGTDPTAGPADDVFQDLQTELTVFPIPASWMIPESPVPSLSVNYRFTPAPHFLKQGDSYAFSFWKLWLEESTDLQHWTMVPAVDRVIPGGWVQAGGTVPAAGPGKMFRLRVSR